MALHATWRRLTRKQPALFQIRDREPVVFPGLLEAIGVARARHLDDLRSLDEGLELVGALPREILGADDDQRRHLDSRIEIGAGVRERLIHQHDALERAGIAE